MRLRGRKGIREDLERQPELVVLEPESYIGKWQQVFGNDHPIHIELGMGKGKFISEWSARNPNVNYIGVDMYDELIRRGAEKAKRTREITPGSTMDNLRLIRMNIEQIETAFAPNELERIYLNFSDPWPKKRHWRRRLTHPDFLRKYMDILNIRGEIHMKTDSVALFEFSLNAFADMGLRMRNISLDLHADGVRDDLVLTEYESKFIERSVRIHRCEVLVGQATLVPGN